MQAIRPNPYQLVPLSKLLRNGRSTIFICDGVGVGKTISAGYIVTFLTRARGMPALVVCPPGLQEKWRNELKGKFGAHVIPIRSNEELESAKEGWLENRNDQPVHVMPSSLLTRESIPSFPGLVVIDELHNFRNPQTKAWKALRQLVAKASYTVGLSATPINNRLEDLAAEFSPLLRIEESTMEAVVQELWTSRRREELAPLMTRFTKENLQIHFAKRLIADVRITYPQAYLDEVQKLVKGHRGRSSGEGLKMDEITHFRLAASSPAAFDGSIGGLSNKPTHKDDALVEILQRHHGQHVIVFCEFERTVRHLQGRLGQRAGFVLTGSTPVFEREAALAAFGKSGNGVLLMTAVGAEGLDLQFCSVVVNFDLTWNPMVLEQRIGRIDRIGQTKTTINIYNFVVAGSIDERIMTTLGRKLGLLDGSLLNPASILGAESPAVPIYTEDEVEAELKSAEELARAIKMSADVVADDYDLLGAIDPVYCDPKILGKLHSQTAYLPWLKANSKAATWVLELERRADALSRTLSAYGAVDRDLPAPPKDPSHGRP